MLSISALDKKNKSVSYLWSVGQENPFATGGVELLKEFHSLEVCASGVELEYISKKFKVIHNSISNYASWFGEEARCIIADLC